MTFSLLTVSEQRDNKVSGNWLQDHIGTLDSAEKRARETNAVNSNRLTIAVVPQINSPVPMYDYWTNLTPLRMVTPQR